MKPKAFSIITLILLLLSMLSACSLPLEVKKINSVNEKANGIRYILKRPSYDVGLRFENNQFEGDLSSEESIDTAAKSCFGDTRLEVILEQNLKGDQLTYEVTTPNGFSRIPHLLSNTVISINTDSDAKLKSFSTGETDKSLEFIQAIAGIALKAMSGLTEDEMCKVLQRKGFIKYAKDHLRLYQLNKAYTERTKNLTKKIIEENDDTLIKVLALLREEHVRIKEDLGNIRFKLEEKVDYSLIIDGEPISTANNPIFEINLTRLPKQSAE